MKSYKLHTDYLPQNYEFDFLYNFKDWNILLKIENVTNNGANTLAVDILNQDHQDYYSWWDQQYIGCRYDGGIEQITKEMVLNIILE